MESRKMAGRKMARKARAVFIFLPAIFLLTRSCSPLLQMCSAVLKGVDHLWPVLFSPFGK